MRLKIIKDLSSLLKVLMDSALRMTSRRLFQAVGLANAKVKGQITTDRGTNM